jgi:hypothetical protein
LLLSFELLPLAARRARISVWHQSEHPSADFFYIFLFGFSPAPLSFCREKSRFSLFSAWACFLAAWSAVRTAGSLPRFRFLGFVLPLKRRSAFPPVGSLLIFWLRAGASLCDPVFGPACGSSASESAATAEAGSYRRFLFFVVDLIRVFLLERGAGSPIFFVASRLSCSIFVFLYRQVLQYRTATHCFESPLQFWFCPSPIRIHFVAAKS